MATSELFSSDSPLDKEHPFSDASVSFAVDISGSTAGRVLQVEQMFISRIGELLSASSQLRAKVLPWCHRSLGVVGLDGVQRLRSEGGTMPHVILENPPVREALRSSSLWFLMTDGLIDERSRARFVHLLPEIGMHGTSCVTVIFGWTTNGPAHCNISVGVNVFSIVPNCLFLYCDVMSGDIMVLGCKGIFASVLGDGVEVPLIDDATTWASLPKFSFESLASLKVPPVQKLGKDQMALQDGTVIDFNDLYSGKLAQDKIDRIFANDDNLNSLTMTTQTRNQQAQWGAWLQQQQVSAQASYNAALAVPRNRPRPDVAGAKRAFDELIDGAARLTEDSAMLDMLTQPLRVANATNMRSFLMSCQGEVAGHVLRQVQIAQSAQKAATTDITNSRALNSTRHFGGQQSRFQQPLGLQQQTASQQGARQQQFVLNQRLAQQLGPQQPAPQQVPGAQQMSRLQQAFGYLQPFWFQQQSSPQQLGPQQPGPQQVSGPQQPPVPQQASRRQRLSRFTNQLEPQQLGPQQLVLQQSGPQQPDPQQPSPQQVSEAQQVPAQPQLSGPSVQQPEPQQHEAQRPSVSLDPPGSQRPQTTTTPKTPDPNAWGNWDSVIQDDNLRQLLYTPGFIAGGQGGAFRGRCTLCRAENMVLAWLFTTPTTEQVLALHRAPALGCGPAIKDLRLLSTALVCEPCSTWCRDTGKSPNNRPRHSHINILDGSTDDNKSSNDRSYTDEKIAAALPMVDTKGNEEAYNAVLGAVFPYPGGQNLRMQAFLSVLLDTEQRVIKTINSNDDNISRLFPPTGTDAASAALSSAMMYLDALRWTIARLLHAIKLSSAIFGLGVGSPQPAAPGNASTASVLPLADILHQAFRATRLDLGAMLPPAPIVLHTTLPEAATLVRAAAAHDIGGESNVSARRAYAFWRIMAEVATTVKRAARANGGWEGIIRILEPLLWQDEQQQPPASPAMTATTTTATLIDRSELDNMEDDDGDLVMVSAPDDSRHSRASSESSGQLINAVTASPRPTDAAATAHEAELPIRTHKSVTTAIPASLGTRRRAVQALAPATLCSTGLLREEFIGFLRWSHVPDFEYVLAASPMGSEDTDGAFVAWPHGATVAFLHGLLRVLRGLQGSPSTAVADDLFAKTLELKAFEAMRHDVVSVGKDREAVRRIIETITAAGN